MSKNKKAKKQNSNQSIEKTYPSAKILFDIIIKEYDSEVERGKSFDSRAGILLPIIAALIALIPTMMDDFDMSKLHLLKHYEIFMYSFVFMLLLINIALLVISSFKFLSVLSTNDYKKINLSDLNQSVASFKEDTVLVKLIISYKDYTDFNHNVNNKKLNHYKNGIKMLTASILITAFMAILMCFI